ncbi:MAG: HEAT repeat domain-containing protein [Acidobacteria bacterium]|nr:HEAT repeat domain-containing protein [Acidobacteriota bacterium]
MRVEHQRKRASRTLAVVAILLVVIPFLFWRDTWFGRPLSDAELTKYISDTTKPRQTQHALVQIGERMARGDTSVSRWYAQVAGLAASVHSEIRVTAAWVMGGDSRSEEFHKALLKLLSDQDALVRRNAALSLVRFGDASGKPELLKILHASTVRSPYNGQIHFRVKQSDPVEQGSVLAEIKAGDQVVEVRAPLPGKIQMMTVSQGAQVASRQEILALSPAAEHLWEALRALYLVGSAEDAAEIEPFASGAVPEASGEIQQQAQLTLAEIRRRTKSPRSR